MSKKESHPGWCEHPGQQLGLDGFDGPISSCNDYTTANGPISRFLLPGRRNAIGLKQLRMWTGLDSRIIRKLIEKERRGGCPILADNATGYYLAENETEKKICVLSMRHRAGEILKTAAAIEAVQL